MPTIPLPLDPDEKTASKVEIRLWKKAIILVVRQQALLEGNNKKLFSLLWGQWSNII